MAYKNGDNIKKIIRHQHAFNRSVHDDNPRAPLSRKELYINKIKEKNK
jgi:hypothetical protein